MRPVLSILFAAIAIFLFPTLAAAESRTGCTSNQPVDSCEYSPVLPASWAINGWNKQGVQYKSGYDSPQMACNDKPWAVPSQKSAFYVSGGYGLKDSSPNSFFMLPVPANAQTAYCHYKMYPQWSSSPHWGGGSNVYVAAPGCPKDFERDLNQVATSAYACFQSKLKVCDKECNKKVGDPVDPGTGTESLSATDYAGDAGLTFRRTFISTKGWLHNFQKSISTSETFAVSPWTGAPIDVYGLEVDACTFAYRVDVNGTWEYLQSTRSLGKVVISRDSESVLTFLPPTPNAGASGNCYAPNTTLTFTPRDTDTQSSLTATTGALGEITGYRYKLGSGDVEVFDAAGRLASIEYRNGSAIALTYDATGLIKATDHFGRFLSFVNTSGRITQMTTPAGGIYSYVWNGNSVLTKATFPDTTFVTYHYENVSFPKLLTGITDEKGVRYATITYDGERYVTNTVLAGGVESTTLNYTDPRNVVVTDALGNAETYQYAIKQNSIRHVGTSRAASGSSPASQEARTLDANGNVESRTDANGNVTTYVYDLVRNLETSRTEASGTPQARTITTQWHATWNQPTQVSEPGRVTVYTYDTRGNRETKTVTDTVTSQTQVWTWAYNSVGQLLSEDGPRTDASDVTTYAYYGSTSPHYGRLYRITNAANQITEFTDYDANGKLLSQVDPNGVNTTFTYDARGRLKTRSSNSKTTSYDYDPVGQLTKVTLPDGNWVEYVYDNAHRLTEIHDKAGNRIVYTLDLMSRRTKEEIKDTQGGFATLLEWIRQSLAVNTPPASL
ncbi:MAG: hypothetical protein K0S46_2232 [Moraxellaceae bacterium]|jgi:YD repeat-containing protein|nr:hypothetical protein [Moraxellaceae bacterium]